MNTLRLIIGQIVLCACWANTPFAFAQTTLTQANHFAPSEGIRYTRYKCDTTGIVAGAGGENAIWDFSNISLAPTFIDAGTYVLPGLTQYSTSFPDANLAEVLSSNQTFYYTDNADSISLLGYVTVSGTNISQVTYTDPFTLLSYPFTYGDNFSDIAARTYANITGTATYNVTADGYGTLVLPIGTFHNVLRLHSEANFNDVSATGTFFELQDDLYEWFDGIHPKPLLSIRVRNVNNNGTLGYNKFVDMADVIAPNSLADDYGYTYAANYGTPAADCQFRDISAVGTLIEGLEDDNFIGTFEFGFPFQYYWASYDRCSVGANGYLIMGDESFNISSSGGNFPRIPTADANNNIIAPLLCDLNFSGAGNPAQAYFYTNQIDTAIILFKNVPFWTNANAAGFAGSNTFEVIFAAADSSITFAYADLSPRTQMATAYQTSIAPAVTGIENNNGTIGLQMALSAIPPDNSCFSFSPPDLPLIDVADIYPQWNENPQNGAVFLLQNSVVNLTTRIKNGGSVAITDTIDVTATIIDNEGNNFGDPVLTQFVGLPQGEGQDLIAWENFPAIEGYYTYSVRAHTESDINNGNDINLSEIIVVDTTSTGEMTLNYVDTDNATQNSLTWTGGGDYADGAGIYIEPPYYPARIEEVSYFVIPPINDPVITSGFRAQVLDDDGGAVIGNGTVLFEQDIPASALTAGTWNAVATDNDTITEGGFYVAWLMQGNGIALATDQTQPVSRRTYEVLSQTWSPYRSRSIEDLYIRVKMRAVHPVPQDTSIIDTTVVDTTIVDTTVNIRYHYRNPYAQLSAPAPNPAKDFAYVQYHLPQTNQHVSITLYDLNGKKQREWRNLPQQAGKYSLRMDLQQLPPGWYTYILRTDQTWLNGKLCIVGN